jgi:hypothetical protein
LIILAMFGEQHKLCNSSWWNFIQFSFFFLWNSNTPLDTLFSITLSLCSSLTWELQLQTHTKRNVKKILGPDILLWCMKIGHTVRTINHKHNLGQYCQWYCMLWLQ